ncbi:Uncharacterised protein [uncultured archaeon]|nr:Uncharacterised protein [uncultured archaeon]
MDLFSTIILSVVLLVASIGHLRKKARESLYSVAEQVDTYTGPLAKGKKNETVLYVCSGDDVSLLDRTKSENVLFYDIEHKTKLKSDRVEQITGTVNHLSLKDKAVDKVYLHPMEGPIQEAQMSVNEEYLELCKEIDRVLKEKGEVILDFEWGRRNVYLGSKDMLHEPLN